MKYKAEYAPSFLLDPETYEYLPFDEVCKSILDKDDHAIFSEYLRTPANEDSAEVKQDIATRPQADEKRDNSMKTNSDSGDDEDDADDGEEELSRPPPPGFLDPDHLPQELLLGIYTFEAGKPLPLILSRTWRLYPTKRKKIQEGIAAMGSAAVETCLFA